MFTITKQRSKADRLAEEMLRLYMLYWMPQVILNVASGQIELGGRWLDPVAEDLYKWLESRLLVAKKELGGLARKENIMLYWMNDETGKVIAREEGDHPGEKWFEISPDDYKANLHPLSRPTQRAADGDYCPGEHYHPGSEVVNGVCNVCHRPRR